MSASAVVVHSVRKLTGLQREVLGLYRTVLRASKVKEAAGHPGIVASAREQFRREAESVGKRNYQKIEYMMRRGQKHVKMLSDPQVKNVTQFLR